MNNTNDMDMKKKYQIFIKEELNQWLELNHLIKLIFDDIYICYYLIFLMFDLLNYLNWKKKCTYIKLFDVWFFTFFFNFSSFAHVFEYV